MIISTPPCPSGGYVAYAQINYVNNKDDGKDKVGKRFKLNGLKWNFLKIKDQNETKKYERFKSIC